ncbi:MAG: hypothetical protein EB060_00765 [Proteobacteria bacterium]|nr:hypothetical protein [Pseudomonadota bacterium]
MWQSLIAKGQFAEALPILERIAVTTPNAEVLHALGTCHKRLGHYPNAYKYYEAVLTSNPAYIDTLREAPSVANMLGFYAKSKEYLMRLNSLSPSAGLKVTLATMLPQMMESTEQIKALREEFMHNLDQLVKDGIVIKGEIHNSLIHSSFYLAYHGMNDREIQRKLAETYTKICPSLLYTAKHVRKGVTKKEKLRVGFFSKYFGEEHPVAIHFAGVIAGLGKLPEFEVSIISKPYVSKNEQPPAWLSSVCKHVVQVPELLSEARKAIEKLALDVLIFTEIGMDPFTYFLAFSKLAPVQCMMGGHPDTTGISAIDYFISSIPVEPENGQDHYNERLIRLANIPVSIKKPALPDAYGRRAQFGLPENLNLYMCPMMLQKIHPEFDDAINGILTRDEKAMVLFFSAHGDWQHQLMQRFKRTMPEAYLRRIGFVPYLPMGQFTSLLSCADVVLDSFHFGGGTTSYIALGIGVPVMTLPSAYMRGRVAYALYQQMGGGFDAVIAKDAEDYVTKAVKLAGDKALQKQLHDALLQKNAVVFENPNAVEDFARMLRSLEIETAVA